MNDLIVKMKFLLPTLPKAEKLVAKFLLENPEAVRGITLLILASETGASDASIIRFCKRLGFDGFSSFKESFISANIDENEVVSGEISKDDSMIDIMKKVFQHNTQTLNDTLAMISEDYTKAMEALMNAKSIHFFGVGDAFAVALLAYMKFSRLGIPGSAHSDVTMQLITAASLSKGDAAFAISYSGASNSVVEAMKIAKEAGATTICITQLSKSPLLKYTDINLFISTSDLTVGKDIISRRIADQAIMEALYLAVLTKSEKDYTSEIKKTQKAIDANKI